MPKVHKSEITKNVINTEDFEYIQVHCSDDLKGRPISGGPEKQTQKVSNLIEILLKTLVTTLKTYMKDDCNSLRNYLQIYLWIALCIHNIFPVYILQYLLNFE